MNETRNRNPWIAALLTFPAPGLGQLYCGKLGRALLLATITLILNPLLLLVLLKAGMGLTSIITSTVIQWTIGLAILIDAWKLARREGRDYQLREFNRGNIYVLFALFATMGSVGAGLGGSLLLKDSYVAYFIPNRSMIPTFVPGDHIMLKRKVYLHEEPKPGDIVVFPSPDNRKHHFIKRVVATPGQTVEIRRGRLFIDQRELPLEGGEETNGKARYAVGEVDASLGFGPFEVPAHNVFVLGDNRGISRDSRHFGPIAINALEGKVISRHWPPQRFGDLE